MPKIFKAGDYGKKGNYTVENFKNWIGKKIPITAGHVGDWIKNKYPVTAIPVAGECTITGVDAAGYLEGEFAYNKFGDSIKEQYPNLSIGIGASGEPNHLAILGYAPPHIPDLDKSFSEFSDDLSDLEKSTLIEFSEEKKDKSKKSFQNELDSFIEKLNSSDATENIDYSKLQSALWDKLDMQSTIKMLKDKGYTVGKAKEFTREEVETLADTIGFTLQRKEQKRQMTEKEMYEKVKAEFTREQEREQLKEKYKTMFPPVMHDMIEFTIDKAFEEGEYSKIIEFSAEDKSSMAEKLKEFSKDGGPFKELFESYMEGKEFSKEDKHDDPVAEAQELAESIYGKKE